MGRVDFLGCKICGKTEGLFNGNCCVECWIDRAEKAEAEVERLTALQAYGVDALNKAEAQVAVMREALERCRATYSHITATDDSYDLTDGINRIDTTLSSEDGKAFLDKVRKLEDVAEAAKGVFNNVHLPASEVLGIWLRLKKALAALDGDRDG